MYFLMNLLIYVIMFFCGLIVFSLKRKHLLLMLLSLEFLILSLFSILFFYISIYDYIYYISMIFVVFCVCESVLGLSILVLLIRTHGNDFFYSMNMLC
uniref:NADH dehydrogenase subunit 4L n=1 Tax=Mastax latefasciata TaxID=2962404 RepID=UPI0021139F86|nr:NADH dehydrogenase subunit 4L [Mastax latefasciata]UTD45015.1 NADH dehydrogenase subunit 4L [Mastax latefasciata]